MANALYPKFKQQLLNKQQDLDTDGIRAILADAADYTYNSAHDFLDDVAGAARVAVSGDLGSPTITDGTFDTADFTWTAVTGDPSEQVILYNHGMGGADSARGLVAFYDTSITGMPVTPNGGDINVTVNASGWFSLVLAMALLGAGVAQAQTDPRTQPLVQAGDMAHLGSFTLPAFDRTGRPIEYGGYSLGLSADGTELYFSCNGSGRMARVQIPTVLDGRQATIVEDCTGPPNLTAIDPTNSNGLSLGGVAWFGGKFFAAAHSYYDADKNASASVWSGASWASLVGPVRVHPTLHPNWHGGTFVVVPSEWRALIGAPMAISTSNLSIISTTSYGPNFSPFNPVTMKASDPLLGYDQTHPLGPEQSVNPLWNRASKGFGAFWPTGRAAVLYGYSHAPKDYWYGPGVSSTGQVDPLNTYQGEHTTCPTHQIAAYLTNDLLEVKAGRKQMWELRPYATWTLSDIAPACRQGQLSMVGDPATNRVYFGHWPGAGAPGVQTVHVYQIAGSVPPQPKPTNCVGTWAESLGDPVPAVCDATQQQKRTRTRTFTVITPEANGGTCVERAQSPLVVDEKNACTYTPPPPPPEPTTQFQCVVTSVYANAADGDAFRRIRCESNGQPITVLPKGAAFTITLKK
ncbi:MAG: hypothetical protein IT181_13075 [Acidobacteria bacterium]|nr:hypothetical protein [Acidobacteriota bacterium]